MTMAPLDDPVGPRRWVLAGPVNPSIGRRARAFCRLLHRPWAREKPCVDWLCASIRAPASMRRSRAHRDGQCVLHRGCRQTSRTAEDLRGRSGAPAWHTSPVHGECASLAHEVDCVGLWHGRKRTRRTGSGAHCDPVTISNRLVSREREPAVASNMGRRRSPMRLFPTRRRLGAPRSRSKGVAD